MENNKLRRETIDLIKQIYKKYPSGGALHIVLDDGNEEDRCILWCLQNSIMEAKKDRDLFEKCAINLLKLGTERQRGKCIYQAFKEMRECDGKS
jgi:hypothetical protein